MRVENDTGFKLPTAFTKPFETQKYEHSMNKNSEPLTGSTAELEKVVVSWPILPDHIKAAILALVGALREQRVRRKRQSVTG